MRKYMPFALRFPFLEGEEEDENRGNRPPQNSKPFESPSAKLSKGLCVCFSISVSESEPVSSSDLKEIEFDGRLRVINNTMNPRRI